jgi:hypothetical protein
VISGHRSSGRRPSAVPHSNTEGPTSQKPSLPLNLPITLSLFRTSSLKHRTILQVESEVTAGHFYPSGDTAYFRVTGQGERETISFHRLSSASALNQNIIAWQLAQFAHNPNESVRLVGEVPNRPFFENRRSGSFRRVLCYSDQACGTERTCTGL